MTVQKTSKIELVFLIVVIIAAGLYFFHSPDYDEIMFLEGYPAIGTHEKFTTGYGKGSGTSGHFYYYRGGEKVKAIESFTTFSNIKKRPILQGDRFLVLFHEYGDKIYYDMPIKDSNDFRAWIEGIKVMRRDYQKIKESTKNK